MSKHKKHRKDKANVESRINLIIAVLNLIAAILMFIKNNTG
jgi:hypothetical protein